MASIPLWAVDYSETDGCGTSWQIEKDGSISVLEEGVVTQTAVGSAVVNGDGTLGLNCPGCGRAIVVTQPKVDTLD